MSKLKIWLITVGEPIPPDSPNERLFRSGIQAGFWSDAGHQVTWWNSTVDHARKRLRSNSDKIIDINANYRLILLHGILYRKNLSIRRIINHLEIAAKFRRLALGQEKPDIIYCSFPTVGLAREAVLYGEKHGVPVIVDIRDLWPDVFLSIIPRKMRFAVKPFFYKIEKDCRYIFSHATAISGLTDAFVEWGLRYASRARSRFDVTTPMAYQLESLSPADLDASKAYWYERGLEPGGNYICFFGTLGWQSEIDTVIAAAKLLDARKANIKFIICGDGDRAAAYVRKSADVKSIMFPGWVNRQQIRGLLDIARAGLVAYRISDNYLLNLPNKPIEYLSCGVPIISGIDGVLGALLRKHDCGLIYNADSPESLADAVQKICNDGDCRKRMSENALALYKKEFMAEEVYVRLQEMFFELISSRNVYTKTENGPGGSGNLPNED